MQGTGFDRAFGFSVDAELHVWDGLFYGFVYNPDVPESRECYDVIVNFFNRHFGHVVHRPS